MYCSVSVHNRIAGSVDSSTTVTSEDFRGPGNIKLRKELHSSHPAESFIQFSFLKGKLVLYSLGLIISAVLALVHIDNHNSPR